MSYTNYGTVTIGGLVADSVSNETVDGLFTVKAGGDLSIGPTGSSKTVYIGTTDNSLTAADITMGDSSKTVTIKGNLIVQGTTTEVNSTTITVTDNVMVLNQNCATNDIDSGILCDRNFANWGAATESGTAQAGAASTITLATGASGTDDTYNN